MANQGKVNRVLREAVAVLVEELGRDDAADMLEAALAQLRGVAGRSTRTPVEDTEKKRRRRVGRRID